MRLAAALAISASVAGAALLVYTRRQRRRARALRCQPCDSPRSPPPGAARARRQSPDALQAAIAFDGVDTPVSRQTTRVFDRVNSPQTIQARKTVGHSRDPDATKKRLNYISWDDYFMAIAVLSSYRSKDPNRQVGACIVDPALQRIVGIGYNGFPIGCGDDVLPWARQAGSSLETKYPYVCHAEMNAIMNKNTASLHNCRIYVTLFPCNECAKLIIQARLAEVVFYSDKYHDTEMMAASRRMFELAGVCTWQHTTAVPHVLVDFEAVR